MSKMKTATDLTKFPRSMAACLFPQIDQLEEMETEGIVEVLESCLSSSSVSPEFESKVSRAVREKLEGLDPKKALMFYITNSVLFSMGLGVVSSAKGLQILSRIAKIKRLIRRSRVINIVEDKVPDSVFESLRALENAIQGAAARNLIDRSNLRRITMPLDQVGEALIAAPKAANTTNVKMNHSKEAGLMESLVGNSVSPQVLKSLMNLENSIARFAPKVPNIKGLLTNLGRSLAQSA